MTSFDELVILLHKFD